MATEKSIDILTQRIADKSIAESLRILCDLYPGRVVFSTSLGQEDQVITEIIAKGGLPIKIFTLDTGRLFYETYELLAKTVARYKIDIHTYYPNTGQVEQLVQDIGINGFYESADNRKSCCYVRKVEPLKRALAGNEIWITGLRAEQSPNRQKMQKLEWDPANNIIKYNALLDWTMDELLTYIQEHRIPYNSLHDRGFVSIGCAPCTRAIEPGEDPRAGRWWWETSQKECGLHAAVPAVEK